MQTSGVGNPSTDRLSQRLRVEEQDKEAESELDLGPARARNFERFQKEFTTLQLFRNHLLSVDGKARSEKVANEMVTDVSKYLRFCAGPVAEEPDFKHFVNREYFHLITIIIMIIITGWTDCSDENQEIRSPLSNPSVCESISQYCMLTLITGVLV